MKCAHCSIGIKVQKTQTVKQYHPKIVWTSNNIKTFTGRRCNEDGIVGMIIFKIWCKINSYIIVSVLLNPYSALSSFLITLKISQYLWSHIWSMLLQMVVMSLSQFHELRFPVGVRMMLVMRMLRRLQSPKSQSLLSARQANISLSLPLLLLH